MKKLIVLSCLILILCLTSFASEVTSPLIQYIGHLWVVYDMHIFQSSLEEYRARGYSETLAANLAAGDTQNDIEARVDKALCSLKYQDPATFDAILNHYGLEFKGGCK